MLKTLANANALGRIQSGESLSKGAGNPLRL
ncbi:hypothetical protein IB223_16295 [Pseudoxanthomonas sp. PXM03]|uniref:Uncharacterized protein n=1 Tax=Pseudoxanthomonas mexicana TaxID=128785 RepID=A0A7G9TD79_PSEMX|nr:hypothetical protein [Pseudoxanthomonas sp. PXM03]MBD9437658.1 hypothetical protein [Pseudoxanthomonas sp. PXM03]QNN78054.1 hypothetical protein IAE60_00990 [Pseudoxanthomonas mexicana]